MMKTLLKENNGRISSTIIGFAFYLACGNGETEVASLLLAHPDIGNYFETLSNENAFLNAIKNGHTSCARMLLSESRIDLNGAQHWDWHTALWYAVSGGHLSLIQCWIASGGKWIWECLETATQMPLGRQG